MAEVAIEHDLVVVTDEVYEHLLFDGREHVPICTLPGMWERTVTISSAGKTFSFTGWKVGWVTGPAELVAHRAGRQAVADLHQRRPAAAGGRARAEPRGRLLRALAKELAGQARPARRGPARPRPRGVRPRGDVLRHHRRAAPTATPDAMAFCLALPERAGVVAIPAQVLLRRPGRGPAPGALGVLQGDRRDRGGRAPAAPQISRPDLQA